MLKLNLKHILYLLVILSLANSAMAWDNTGHKVTTYIAWERMTPKAREQASRILLAAPEDSHISVYYPSDSRSMAAKQLELFMIASTWSDLVRDRKFAVRYEKYNKGGWHIASSLWKLENGQVKIIAEPDTQEGNAVIKLAEFDKLLRDATVSDAEKAVALAWILHMGGDIHQPLHTSGRVTELEPEGDRGANLFMLSSPNAPREQTLNLHSFWDGILSRNTPRVNDAPDSIYLPAIARNITQKYPFAMMEGRLKLGQFDEWRAESFKLATTELFPAILKRGEVPPADYNSLALKISEERIALAGYRMGEMLNQIFGN